MTKGAADAMWEDTEEDMRKGSTLQIVPISVAASAVLGTYGARLNREYAIGIGF